MGHEYSESPTSITGGSVPADGNEFNVSWDSTMDEWSIDIPNIIYV